MRPSLVEEWALRVIAALKQGRPLEDARVELKSTWPEPTKAARRIAGHANAAHGEEILWLIGVAQDGALPGLDQEDLANWWPQLLSHMRPPLPEAQPVTVYTDNQVALALLIDTSRAPYLVKNPAYGTPEGGPVEFEVPWRDMTAVRTARHEDLIRLLVPRGRLPLTEVLLANLHGQGKQDEFGKPSAPAIGGTVAWTLTTAFYFVPQQQTPVVLPGHKCRIRVTEDSIGEEDFQPLGEARHGSHLILSPLGDIVIDRPMRVEVLGRFDASAESKPGGEAVAHLHFTPAGEVHAIQVTCHLKRVADWRFTLADAKISTD